MKSGFALTLFLFAGALSMSLSAAELVVDISSFAPRDPDLVFKQIELNIAIKQYEKAMDECDTAVLHANLGPEQSNLSVEEMKKWQVRAEQKVMILKERIARLHDQIRHTLTQAYEKSEKLKLKVDAQPMPKEVPGK